MVLKIHGHPKSPCTRRVMLVAKLVGLPYELVLVDWPHGEHKSAAYMENQPFGQVPYIDDDGFILYESRAIARYLLLKTSAHPLYPPSAHSRALAEQAISVEQHNFAPFALGVLQQRLVAKTPDEARVRELVGLLAQKLDGYERVLGRQRYLAGGEMTLGDVFHVSYAVMLAPQGVGLLADAERWPNVARWWKEMAELPAWKAILEEYGEY